MSMMDFAGALGGGGAPPGAGPPPIDLGAPPPEPPPEQGGEQQFTSSVDALDAAEQALHAFIQLDQDEPDRAAAATALQTVLKLKASNQQAQQSGDMKGLARALQGAGAGGGY